MVHGGESLICYGSFQNNDQTIGDEFPRRCDMRFEKILWWLRRGLCFPHCVDLDEHGLRWEEVPTLLDGVHGFRVLRIFPAFAMHAASDKRGRTFSQRTKYSRGKEESRTPGEGTAWDGCIAGFGTGVSKPGLDFHCHDQ